MSASPADRLRELAKRWGRVRIEIEIALLELDKICYLDQAIPRVLMEVRAAKALAAELAFNMRKLARDLERPTLPPK